MTINSYSKAIIVFSDEELDTIDRMSDILEAIRAELNHQDTNLFEANGTVFNSEILEEALALCYDLSNDSIAIEKSDDGER